VGVESCRAAKPDAPGSRNLETRARALANEGSLEFGHGAKDVKLQLASGAIRRSVDALRSRDQRNPVCGEFINQRSQVREAAAQAVEFLAKDDIDLSFTDTPHEFIEAEARELRTTDPVGEFSGHWPASSGAEFTEFETLWIEGLLAGRDSQVKGDVFHGVVNGERSESHA
jgi:hypothetical protein